MADNSRRRVRRRCDAAVSALKGLEPWDRPQEALNRNTPGIVRCAWPGCRASMQHGSLQAGMKLEDRYGVLCKTHAVDVAVAVTQHQRDLRRMEEFFEQQSSERAVRAAQWRAEDERYEAEKAALRQDRDGFVYYISIGDRLKIGFSKDVRRRMRAYPPESKLLAVEPGDKDLERARHQQFRASLTHGREWFTPTADLREHIDAVLAEHGEPPRSMAHHYGTKRQPMRLSRRP